jgi:hypothetical protein
LEIELPKCKKWFPLKRALTFQSLVRGYPILAITGPWREGKAALAQSTFPDKPRVSLEDPHTRGLTKWAKYAGAAALPAQLVYGGDLSMTRQGVEVHGWRDMQNVSVGKV